MSTLAEAELELLTDACRRIPPTNNTYIATDYVSALLDTVIDYQNRPKTVRRAIEHFNSKRWNDIRTQADVEACLARFPDHKDGNEQLARYLWGYRFWTRTHQLRGLVSFLDDFGISTLEDLQRWARGSSFDDFRGKVPGLGFVLYQWLVMRMGVETVKPDSRILGFIREVIGRGVWETEAVEALEEVARRLNVRANALDWSIWEYRSA